MNIVKREIREKVPAGAGPCAKRVVTATIVALNGQRFIGSNQCRTPQAVCPRGDMPRATGYELCRDVCGQDAHAEVSALALAGAHAEGASMYLEGIGYACTMCADSMSVAGIDQMILGAPPALDADHADEVADDDRGEVSRCPYCGDWSYIDEVERPSYHCHHDIAPEPHEPCEHVAQAPAAINSIALNHEQKDQP